jgi:hypothetical protein
MQTFAQPKERIYSLLAKESVIEKSGTDGGLLANLLRLQVSRSDIFDWKEDYIKALEEKYENIY